MNLAELRKPFPPDRISWRIGSTNGEKTKGMALAYIDARDVMERLDEVCGVEGWQCRYVPMHDKKTVCEIGIKISHGADLTGSKWEWVWKADGAGDSDVEAEKGALSDALKRAAVRWGIGRYLYDLDSPWVDITAAGRSFKIKDDQYAKLRACLIKSAPAQSQQRAIHNAPTMQPDDDVAAGARNWVDKQKDTIIAFSDMDALDNWLKKNAALNGREGNWDRPTPGSALDKLLKFSAPLFNELKTYYMEKMREV